MRSKTSLFSATVFKKNLTRYWPLWAAYLAVWLVVFPLQLATQLQHYNQEPISRLTIGTVLTGGLYGGTFISMAAGLFGAMAVWNYLYGSRSAGMYASLPISRTGLFITNALSVLCILFACNLMVFLISLLVELVYGVPAISFLLQWLAIVCMLNVFFFGFATFCAMLTGHIVVLPVLYIVLSFSAAVVTRLVNNILVEFVYGYTERFPAAVQYLSPVMALMTRCGVFYEYDQAHYVNLPIYFYGWMCIAAYCVTGLALLALALVLYRRRRMEAAGDVVAVSPLKPVFKYCLSFGGALVLGSLLYSLMVNRGYGFTGGVPDMIKMCVLMVIGAFIGWFAAEMLVRKSLRVFRRGWLGFGIVSVAVVAMMFSAELDLFGYEKWVPESGEVESISIHGSFNAALDTENPDIISEAVTLHEKVIVNKDEGGYGTNSHWCWFTIGYTLKNGGYSSRQYYLPYDATARMEDQTEPVKSIYETLNRPEFVEESLRALLEADNTQFDYSYVAGVDAEDVYQERELTPEEARELFYDCIYPDLRDGTLPYSYLDIETERAKRYSCSITISLRVNRGAENEYYIYYLFTPTTYSERTNAWLESHGIALVKNSDLDDGRYEKAGVEAID